MIVVTGGAGFIGSALVRRLGRPPAREGCTMYLERSQEAVNVMERMSGEDVS